MRRCLTAIAVVLAFACDAGPSEPTDSVNPTEPPNVTVFAGAEIVSTDTAVLVNGERCIDFGSGPKGFGIYHFKEFRYGGMYSDGDDELVGESWFMDLARRVITDVRGDSVFSRSLNFGDVALEGTPARRVEIDTMIVTDMGDYIRVYENILLNRISIYEHQLNLDGSEVNFNHEPFYERMLAGSAVELTATGSDEIGPTSASLTIDAGPQIIAMWSGDALNFQQVRPVFHTDQPLVVDFDRPVDPNRTVVDLAFVQPPPYDIDPDVVQRASAVFMLVEWADRMVIPASALAEIVSHVPIAEGEFIFRVYEYSVFEDVLDIERLKDGISESLSGWQSNGTGFYVRMHQ